MCMVASMNTSTGSKRERIGNLILRIPLWVQATSFVVLALVQIICGFGDGQWTLSAPLAGLFLFIAFVLFSFQRAENGRRAPRRPQRSESTSVESYNPWR